VTWVDAAASVPSSFTSTKLAWSTPLTYKPPLAMPEKFAADENAC
jgi:hypothetical protein